MSEQTFEQQVSSAAQEAGIPADAPMTTDEAALPATEHKPEGGSPDEPAKPPVKAEEPAPPLQTVPLAVHIRQREKHDREVRELREQFTVGNQRLQELMDTLQPKPAAPDPNSDPLGAALAKLDGLEQNVNQVVQATAQERQTAHLREQIRQLERAVYEDEQAYTVQAPDLKEAMQYAKDVKFREYTALGMDPQQAALRVQQDAFALATHAFQNGLSPSQLVYDMAVVFGWKKGAAPAAAAAQPQRDATGKFVAEAPAPAAQASAAEQAVEMRAAGADRAKGGGGAPENLGPLTLQQLATMDNEEFAKMTAGKKWDKLMRG